MWNGSSLSVDFCFDILGVTQSIKEILLPLFIQVGASDTLRADSLGFWRAGDERFWLPRFVFQRTAKVKSRIKVGVFAGIHGDEPAGILGLIDFVRELDADPQLGKEFQLWLYPLCNPSGFMDNQRHSRSGLDLNRHFWCDSREPEIQLLEGELRRQAFNGIISLHSDDTSDGMYGFVRGHTLTKHLMEPALAAAEAALPRNKRALIDGFHAVEGIIHSGYGGILSAPPGSSPEPFEMVIETPQHAPVDLQRQAFVLALRSILTEYREFISYAADI
jgi:hypothetical protein